MKESETYTAAMKAVIADPDLNMDETLEVLEILFSCRRLAQYNEELKAATKE